MSLVVGRSVYLPCSDDGTAAQAGSALACLDRSGRGQAGVDRALDVPGVGGRGLGGGPVHPSVHGALVLGCAERRRASGSGACRLVYCSWLQSTTCTELTSLARGPNRRTS